MPIQFNLSRWLAALIVGCAALLAPDFARAVDLSNGLMVAVPVPGAKPPALDGTDNGWDLSAAEPVWYSNQLAKQLHANLALNYSDSDLYVYARMSLPDRKMINANGPADEFWQGDLLQFRFGADPSLPRPLNMQKPEMRDSDRICHLALWKNTLDGKTYIAIHYGGFHGGGKGDVFNPPDSKISVTEGTNEYVIQAKIPWAALHAPGGKNPFVPGQSMSGIFELHWLSPTFFYVSTAVYASNPGDFAFLSWGSWGQIQFGGAGHLKPRHQTMEEALQTAGAAPVGVPIDVKVPEDGKISVNILGPRGEVLRELTGGQSVKAGKFTAYWDGKDQWGFALPPKDYKWGAYFSKGLKARYVGFVGSSGNPPYQTLDGNGGWGGDHGVPMAVASDAGGIYFGFFGCEAERQIVKLDYAGNTIWRKSPFLKGGFPTLYALTSNGKYLFGAFFGEHPSLCRMDATTGVMALYGTQLGAGASVPIVTDNTPVAAPANSLPAENGLNKNGTAPECMGIAATDKEVFASVYSQNLIQVLDIETGKPTRTLACPSPRGLALDSAGNLYAASFGSAAAPQVVRFSGVQGEAKPFITTELIAPVGVAVDASGGITVTDQGESQQVKSFDSHGKLVRTLGKKGGRAWAGTYDNTSYLAPTGIVADKQGAIVVAEASIPKIFDRIELATGKTLTRWFGWPGYGVSNIGDSDDPFTSYYPFEPEGFARAHVPAEGKTGYPDAYWVPSKAQPDAKQRYGYGMLPFVERLTNDKKYFIGDSNPHTVCLIDGDNLLPVNSLDVRYPKDKRTPELTSPMLSMWIDRDGAHQPTPEQTTLINTIDGGKPLPMLATGGNSIWIDLHGNAYLLTQKNSILKIPAEGFEPSGAIKWNADKATLVVSPVIPSLIDHLGSGPRSGLAGVRVDSHRNLYTAITATVPALTPELAEKIEKAFPDLPQSQWCVYASAEIAKRMHEGLGHTAESNAVKFAKFGPNGKLLWMAGRKATAVPVPGEMYHFWSLAGMVDDNYVAGASEWGPIYFYTSDGYYVDALMNDPSGLTLPGPYTFGSENFAGRIETYDKLGKVYAYDQGGIYAVDGFTKDLKVEGERRLSGTVKLDKAYDVATTAETQSLAIAPLKGAANEPANWRSSPPVTLSRGSAPLATAQLGYDDTNLYARVHIEDDTPLQNSADDLGILFKGGDVVGLDLGPKGDRDKPGIGDVRILAAMVHGKPHLLGMKAISSRDKQPLTYTTPASGTKTFDFVADIPNGAASLTPDPDGKGYTALLTIPRSFLEFEIAPNTQLKGDIEVLLSGQGQRGLQAISRNWLFSGGHVETTMVDDIPTEAWLYPRYWGEIGVK